MPRPARSGPEELDDIEAMRRYYAWKADLVAPHLGARVIEAGCGTGLMLERLAGPAMLLGIDHVASCVERARSRVRGRPGRSAALGNILAPDTASLRASRPDTVLFANSLEEVADERLALLNSSGILDSGGRVVVICAASPALSGELDSGFGIRRFTPRRLRNAMEEAGFAVTVLRYANLLGALGWWMDSRLLRRRSVSRKGFAARDRFVPIARLLDRLTGPPWGMTLMAVGVKRPAGRDCDERALIEDLESIESMKRHYRWKRDLLAPHLGPRVLEVGCGTGLMLDLFADREFLMGIDRFEGCVERARARMAGRPNVEVRHVDVQDDSIRSLAPLRFSSALFANSLELVEDDSRGLGNAAAVVEPGGRLVVLTWALEDPPPAVRATYGLRGYSPERLGRIMAGAGCRDIRIRYVNLLGIPGWWWDRRKVVRTPMDGKGFALRDLAIPLARMVDRLTGPPRGRLILAVGTVHRPA